MKNTNTSYLLLITMLSVMGKFLFEYDWVVTGRVRVFHEPFIRDYKYID